MRLSFTRRLLALASVAVLGAAACAPQAAAPTAAPAKPAPTAAPAKPAPTTAPAKAEAPAAKPAATAAPAARPTEKPASKAEAKPAFDEKAVADFYKGKTIRIVVGYGPGGSTDVNARLLQKVLGKYVPGNPSVIVENKPGAGGLLAANTVYASEPKDGTVFGAFSANLVLQQAIGAKGVQFDAAKYNWLGSTYDSPCACAVRTDSGINSIQDVLDGGKEVTMASFGKGSASYDPPAVFNAALGTRFKIVTGYESDPATILAVRNKEVQGWCTSFEGITSVARDMFEGSNPIAKVIIVTGDRTPDHPFLKGVPAAETLAKTEEAKALLQAVQVPFRILLPHAAPAEVPKDRVEALRRARDKSYLDPELLAAAGQAKLTVNPKTGEEVAGIFQSMLSTHPATLAKLKAVLE